MTPSAAACLRLSPGGQPIGKSPPPARKLLGSLLFLDGSKLVVGNVRLLHAVPVPVTIRKRYLKVHSDTIIYN